MKKKNIIIGSVAALLSAVTAIFIIKKKRKSPHQVPIENPGDQSEFPAAPSDERNLG